MRKSVRKLIGEWSAEFSGCGIDTAEIDARVLVLHGAGITYDDLVCDPHISIGAELQDRVERLCRRRKDFEPVAYLTGCREFWSLPFKVTRDTLIPRPDSETIVECVLSEGRRLGGSPRLADLGTGSGCLLLSLIHEMPGATGIGIDLSWPACKVAQENAERLGLSARASFVCGSWLDTFGTTFDVIVANPPYISFDEMCALPRDVRDFEPPTALMGGEDGLAPLRRLADSLAGRLKPGGLFVCEIGAGQSQEAAAILDRCGLSDIDTVADLNDIPRCVTAWRQN